MQSSEPVIEKISDDRHSSLRLEPGGEDSHGKVM